MLVKLLCNNATAPSSAPIVASKKRLLGMSRQRRHSLTYDRVTYSGFSTTIEWRRNLCVYEKYAIGLMHY